MNLLKYPIATRVEGKSSLKERELITVSEFEKGKPTRIKSKENNPAINDSKIFLKNLNELNKIGLPNLKTLSEALKEEDFDTEEVLKYLQAKKRVGFIITDQGKQFLKENKK